MGPRYLHLSRLNSNKDRRLFDLKFVRMSSDINLQFKCPYLHDLTYKIGQVGTEVQCFYFTLL